MKKQNELVAFCMPKDLHTAAKAKAKKMDLSFAQFVRRAIKAAIVARAAINAIGK